MKDFLRTEDVPLLIVDEVYEFGAALFPSVAPLAVALVGIANVVTAYMHGVLCQQAKCGEKKNEYGG